MSDTDGRPRWANESARLSALLFSARESVEMFADVVESQTGRAATQERRLVGDIDEYRRERGWPEHGFGGES